MSSLDFEPFRLFEVELGTSTLTPRSSSRSLEDRKCLASGAGDGDAWVHVVGRLSRDRGIDVIELTIDKTWDGLGIPACDLARVGLSSDEGGLCLEVEAPFHGGPGPPGAIGSTWELRQYEVFELFVLGSGEAYTEIELGPYGHYLALRCEGRRRIVEKHLPIVFRATREGSRWTGVATIPWSHLPVGPYRMNAYRIHGQGKRRRYLAWSPVPGAEPDFHRLECFRAIDPNGLMPR